MPGLGKFGRGRGAWASPTTRRVIKRWPDGGDGAFCATCGRRMVADLASEGHATHPTCDPEFLELLDRARARGIQGRPVA